MRKFIAPLTLSSLFVLLSIGIASAYQHLVTHRIFTGELISATLGDQGVEDPATLILEVGPSPEEITEIIIESDDSLDECLQNIERIKDYSTGYVEILVDHSAQTMNGVMVLHCTDFYAPQINPQ